MTWLEGVLSAVFILAMTAFFALVGVYVFHYRVRLGGNHDDQDKA